jgi:hypothetical protein
MSRADVALASPEPMSPLRKATLSAEIFVRYVRVRWLVFRYDVPTVVAKLRDDVQEIHEPRIARRIGHRLGGAVGRALRPVPADTRCLMRSLVLTNMLARRGVRGSVVIGVQPGEQFEAHAWVEHEGVPLLPTLDYSRLTEL